MPRVLSFGHFKNGTAPELHRMAERLRQWRQAYPALCAKFFRFQGAICVLCGRVTQDFLFQKEDGTGVFHLAAFFPANSAAQRAVDEGGADAFYYAPLEPGEVWCAWCRNCPTPQTDQEWERMAAAAQRRALGA